MKALNTFFHTLWQQYSAICPQALAIHRLFESEGEVLVNDHIAFRTFSNSNISIDCLEPEIFALGYQTLDNYHFEQKQLDARCYIHSQSDTKIFVSELLWQNLSLRSQTIIKAIIQQASTYPSPKLNAGRLWQLPSYENYCALLDESEYAAWLSIWGLVANHFTLFINHFSKYSRLEQVVSLLEKEGYTLNTVGGVIKGCENDLLIQASTMADKQTIEFSDAGNQDVSSCYYEFAQRFPLKDGSLFQGFVPSSADKIFESTSDSAPLSLTERR